MTEKNELVPDDMKFVIEAIGVGIWKWNIPTGECWINNKWAELIGYTLLDFSNRIEDWENNTHPDDLKTARNKLDRHFRGEIEYYDCDFRMRHREGYWVWINSKGKVIDFNEDGSPKIMFGIHKDIIQRKKAEKALKESEERFRQLFDKTSGLAIQGYSPERKVVYWNKASEELYGYTEKEAFGKDLLDLIIPDELKEGVRSAIDHMNRTGENIPAGELRLKDKANNPVDVFSSHTLIRFENREPELFCIDMNLRELKKERERAQAANIAKSEFLANMSHELRTPLNGVIGFSQILKDTELNVEQKEYTDIIMNSASSLLELIDDILDFSKIEAGKLKLKYEPANLFEAVDQVIKLIRLKAEERGLFFSTSMDKTIPDYLLMDRIRFKQVLLNLLSNAVKFTDSGYIHLDIKDVSPEQNADKVTLLIAVTDTGIGIRKENIIKIMEPFNQEDYSITRRFGGTGLGLNITQNLLTKMNSTLQIESESLRGSRFFFEVEFSKAKQPVLSNALSPNNLNDKTILIVEDNVINMTIAESLLYKVSGSLNVQRAFSGKAALEMLRKEKPDLILMDLKMPVLDGYETTKIIRAKYPKLPIIALTAMGVTDEREKCFEYGMNDYLSKPFSVEKLKTTLLKHL